MKFTKVVDEEYKSVSETVVKEIISSKRDMKLHYELMPLQIGYDKSLRALQNSYKGNEAEVPSQMWYEVYGRKIIRPLTFKENILALVDDFETLKDQNGSKRTIEDRLQLFKTWLDSCTGIANSKNNDDFMIIPVCKELITIPNNFCKEYIQIDYASLKCEGISLKRSQAKYDRFLTEFEVITHPAWIAIFEEDISLLCTYTSIVFNHVEKSSSKAMKFYLKKEIKKDQISNLFINYRNYTSISIQQFNVHYFSFFLRGTLS